MDKNELLRKLTEREIELLKAKGGALQAGMHDVSCYDNEIAKVEYVKTLAMMLDEPEKADKPEEKPVKIPEDYWHAVSVFNMCRILSDKCDKEIDAMKWLGANETYDKLRYEDVVKLKDNCRRFLTDWAIHDPARS